MSSGVSKKFADQKRGGILSGLLGETLGEREDVAFGKIQFHALHAVHGKEDDAGGEGFAILDLRGQIVERGTSTPRMLTPSPPRWRIAPQNFSRGLVNVAITSAP